MQHEPQRSTAAPLTETRIPSAPPWLSAAVSGRPAASATAAAGTAQPDARTTDADMGTLAGRTGERPWRGGARATACAPPAPGLARCDGALSPDAFQSTFDEQAAARRKAAAKRLAEEQRREEQRRQVQQSLDAKRAAVRDARTAQECRLTEAVADSAEPRASTDAPAHPPVPAEDGDDDLMLDELLALTGGPRR
jgi:hypothetical protein